MMHDTRMMKILSLHYAPFLRKGRDQNHTEHHGRLEIVWRRVQHGLLHTVEWITYYLAGSFDVPVRFAYTFQ